MTRSAVLVIAAVTLLPASTVAVLPAPAHADNPTLNAIVGTNDGFNITLNDASGKKVARLAPGTYTIVVDDRSQLHNFHLASNTDPTVDFRTDLEFVGKQSFTVTFRTNTRYAYACEPHWQVMNGSFFVGVSPPPSPPPAPLRTLRGSVSTSGTVRLSSSSVPSGRYRILVSDRSRLGNFHLTGRGVNKRTGMRFTGSASWQVRLARGRYSYGSDRQGLRKQLRVR